mgnify:CR=1 FL=1
MAVDDDNLGGFWLADASIPAQTQHVLGMAVTASVTRNGLHGEERKPSFPAQPLHDVDGGDVDITLRTAVVRFAGEDGRNVAIQRLVVERLPTTDLVGIATEPGSKFMIHGLDLPWLGFPRSGKHRAETLPVGETGGATGVGGFAGNRLHGMAKPWRKLGGSRSEGRSGQRPKHLT